MLLETALAFFQEGTRSETPAWFSLFPILIFFLILYFIVLRPQIKQQKEQRKMIDALKRGDKVITNGGIWGEIDSVEPQVVKLKLNDKTKIMISRSAISGLQPSSGEESKAAEAK